MFGQFKFLLAFALLVGTVAADSCVGRCGLKGAWGSCGCDRNCGDNCCSDYKTTCYSCEDRCDAAYDVENLICQCTNVCRFEGNCCSDYTKLCDGESHDDVLTDQVLKTFSNDLSLMDVNGIKVGSDGFTVSLQSKVSSGSHEDKSANPLINLYASLNGETYTTFEKLRDNYSPNVKTDDQPSSNQDQEVDNFLTAVMKTEVMKSLEDFISKYNLLSSSTNLKTELKRIWFTTYPRGGTPSYIQGSSGFEHVFIGETDKGDIGGFHNWVSYTREEEQNRADYRGYIKSLQLGDSAGYIIKDSFTWVDGSEKSTGGYLVGPSVEHDLAVFTLCWLARPNVRCYVQTHGMEYPIQTYEQNWNGKQVVGTAYPAI